MVSKLKEAKKAPTKATSVTMSTRVKESKEPPSGAIILSEDITTSTEEIENGWLISKSYDIRYQMKKDGDSNWSYYTKKWYSVDNPIAITVTDKSLADEFDDTK